MIFGFKIAKYIHHFHGGAKYIHHFHGGVANIGTNYLLTKEEQGIFEIFKKCNALLNPQFYKQSCSVTISNLEIYLKGENYNQIKNGKVIETHIDHLMIRECCTKRKISIYLITRTRPFRKYFIIEEYIVAVFPSNKTTLTLLTIFRLLVI